MVFSGLGRAIQVRRHGTHPSARNAICPAPLQRFHNIATALIVRNDGGMGAPTRHTLLNGAKHLPTESISGDADHVANSGCVVVMCRNELRFSLVVVGKFKFVGARLLSFPTARRSKYAWPVPAGIFPIMRSHASVRGRMVRGAECVAKSLLWNDQSLGVRQNHRRSCKAFGLVALVILLLMATSSHELLARFTLAVSLVACIWRFMSRRGSSWCTFRAGEGKDYNFPLSCVVSDHHRDGLSSKAGTR